MSGDEFGDNDQEKGISGDYFGHSDVISPTIERRIKDCYQYNQMVSETVDFSQRILKASSNIAKITGEIIKNTNPEASKAMYLKSVGELLGAIQFNGETLKKYLSEFPIGFEPSNNFSPEMCAACESKYIRSGNFKCKPHATPVYIRNTSNNTFNTVTLQSSINQEPKSE